MLQNISQGGVKAYVSSCMTVLKQQSDNLFVSSSANRLNRFLQYSAFAMILFGTRLCLIQQYGNATPFWDQWDGEAANLYKPYLDGTLTFKDLLTPHNEHRIFTTRILALLLLKANNNWNPLLQMVVNAGLQVFMLSLAVNLISRVMGKAKVPALLLFSLILFTIPFGLENILGGFQSQFYFVLLFGFLTIWSLVMSAPLSGKWWLGIGWALLAFFSLASGVFALGAVTVICSARYLLGPNKTYRQLIAIVIMAALFALGIKYTPTIIYHDVYKASSLDQLYNSLITVFGWPISKSLPGALICNTPALLFLIQLARRHRVASDSFWFLAALVTWSFGQLISLAYGRATINLSSRYLDVFSIHVLLNFACLVTLAKSTTPKSRGLAIGSSLGWTGIVLIYLGCYAGKITFGELKGKKEISMVEETNTRNFLATGDSSYIKNKELFEIPYPDADRLALILSWPEIKQILPGNINPLKPVAVSGIPGAFIPNGYSPGTMPTTVYNLGSYHEPGARRQAMGTARLSFNITKPGIVQFAVTGYPANDSMKVEIEQNGERTPVRIKQNPEIFWQKVYTEVKGPFNLIITDSSTIAEMGVTMPAMAGRLDQFTDKLFSNYFILIIAGITILAILLLQVILKRSSTEKTITF